MHFSDYSLLRQKAFNLVKEKSGDEMRYYSPLENQPYWTHLMNVHNLLVTQGVTDYEILLASILHDIVEDSDISKEYIEEEFSKRIAEVVVVCTKPVEYVPDEFYSNILEFNDLGACYIKIADRIDNMLTNYCYSEKALNTNKYIEETERYFIPLAERAGVAWLQALENSLSYYKKHRL